MEHKLYWNDGHGEVLLARGSENYVMGQYHAALLSYPPTQLYVVAV